MQFLSLQDACGKLEAWRKHYNEERPHRAIGNIPPIMLANSAVKPAHRIWETRKTRDPSGPRLGGSAPRRKNGRHPGNIAIALHRQCYSGLRRLSTHRQKGRYRHKLLFGEAGANDGFVPDPVTKAHWDHCPLSGGREASRNDRDGAQSRHLLNYNDVGLLKSISAAQRFVQASWILSKLL